MVSRELRGKGLTTMATLRKGSLAYLDSFSGLVPCKVIRVIDTWLEDCPTCISMVMIRGKAVKARAQYVNNQICPQCNGRGYYLPKKPIRFELSKGGVSGRYKCDIKLTATRCAYKRGEILKDQFAHDVVPRESVSFRTSGNAMIRKYDVEIGG